MVRRTVKGAFNQMGKHFCVGLRTEDVSLFLEFLAQLGVVLDDAIMDHDQAANAVGMGMCIYVDWSPVRSPACVTKPERTRTWTRSVGDSLSEVGNLACTAMKFNGSRGREDCNTSGIVTAIFELTEAFK